MSAGPAVTADAGPLAGSRAVLVGVSAYEYAGFPPIRAARNSMEAMCALLSDPALCGWPSERITVIANPISAPGLASQIADLAESTSGVLLLYYVGHGVLSATGELCLTVTSTRPDRPKISGLPWATLAEVLRGCPATVRLVILDCCFASQTTETLTGETELGLADIAHVEGVYTLAATTGNHAAHVPPPGQQDTACTSFTGELRDLIRSGLPGKGPRLTLTDIYPVLRQRLQGKGLPVPSQRGTDAADQFQFSANAAIPTEPIPSIPAGSHAIHATPREDPEPAQPANSRHAGLVADALRAAHSIPDDGAKAQALAAVADAVAATDPDRAARLTNDAERLAHSTPDQAGKAAALVTVAQLLAATDPDRAERLARAITDPSFRAPALTAVAGALAATDPRRAARLSNNAERLAGSIPDPANKAAALAPMAQLLAATNPDRAELLADAITSPSLKAPALAAVADAVAATDPDRNARLTADAERLARSIPGASLRAPALATVAKAMAATDAGHAARLLAEAERLAGSVPDPPRKAAALAAVVQGMAATDPGRAERLARAITDPSFRAQALAAAAKVPAATDPVPQ